MSLDVHPQLLRALRAVLEAGSFTAASERLGFTQSALSKQIASLESAAGVALFRRGPRGVEPTPAATRLGQRAAAVLDQLDAAERELADTDLPLDGRVALGGFPTTAMQLVPRTIAQVAREHPAVVVDFAESSTPVQLRRLRAGRLDLAVIATGPGLPDYDLAGIETELLPVGPLRVAVGRGHRLATRAVVSVAELADELWIAGRGARGEPQFGAWPTLAQPHIRAELGEWSSRLGFVAAGLGITTVPSLATAIVPGDVVTVVVDDPDWPGRSMRLARVGELRDTSAVVRSAIRAQAEIIAARG